MIWIEFINEVDFEVVKELGGEGVSGAGVLYDV